MDVGFQLEATAALVASGRQAVDNAASAFAGRRVAVHEVIKTPWLRRDVVARSRAVRPLLSGDHRLLGRYLNLGGQSHIKRVEHLDRAFHRDAEILIAFIT